jgi:GT2 family glycosyltransferase
VSKKPQYCISVIIVNYNVEFFLEQCLNSVRKAMEGVNGQVFVVDNNSIDGSVEMVQNKFPEYSLIDNKENLGFSKANNQAIRLSDAKYVLLLNPDTVVEEDTFSKVIDFMDSHDDAGGLGVRMVDGKGIFLPESKRGLPTPAVAFYKIFGLSRIFPKSKRFGSYHLGYLSEFDTNEIDILSGAFMLMRSEALDKVGLLDEAFFMYGEDIDLSYRIQKGGYKNYYFPETRIIHYKGESTKKSSVNYVFVFYRAMVIFARKHFSQKNAWLFSFLINAAIYFRASLAIVSRFIRRATLPVVDFLIICMGLIALTDRWKHVDIRFPSEIIKIAIPAYALVWLIAQLFIGSYDKPLKLLKFVKASVPGTIAILVVYALLPKDWQFSRLYILLGALWTISYYLLSRIFLHFAHSQSFSLGGTKSRSFAVVGKSDEFERVKALLIQTYPKIELIEHVSVGSEKAPGSVGTISQLDQIAHIHKIDEIVFCARDTSAREIISWMTEIDSKGIDFKIAQPDSFSLIGSNSIETAGDLYVLNIDAISKPENQRAKRSFDLIFGLMLFIFSPILIWSYASKMKFLRNVLSIITGKRSIVGYGDLNEKSPRALPRLKPGILSPSDGLSVPDPSLSDKLDLIYARDYRTSNDLSILTKAWRKLDR